MAFRFVHTADIHLDSPLKSLALKNPALRDLVGNATRDVFVRIIDLCIDERVDALLIAGDLYDGEQTSMKTALFLARQIARLDEAGIRCFIIRGNHDALSKITRELVLPDNVKVFGPRADIVEIDRGGGPSIAIHGLSFSDPKAPESLLPRYKAPVNGAINIGLMHTSLNGSAGHDPYAPCSIADLDGSGFRYWALGHIHARSVHVGSATIVMPGIPQGRDVNEAGPKSVTLVTIGDGGEIDLDERIVSIAQFHRHTVDVSEAGSWEELPHVLDQAIRRHAASGGDDHRILRLQLSGTSPLAWRIRRDLDLLRAEADLVAERFNGVWLETMETSCRPIETKSVSDGDPVDELMSLIRTDILGTEGFANRSSAIAAELEKSLPKELRNFLGTDEDEVPAMLAALASEGVDDVLARLRSQSRPEDAQ